jgi:hypothetical protein
VELKTRREKDKNIEELGDHFCGMDEENTWMGAKESKSQY